MFELIKAMVELLGKSIPNILEAKKKKNLNAIGTDLFLLYTSLNNILVVGRRICAELESGLNWMKRKVQEGEPDRELNTHLDFLLSQQMVNILNFIKALKSLQLQVQIIAPEAYAKLIPLIHGKYSALSLLINAMDGRYSKPQLVVASEEKLGEIMRIANEYITGDALSLVEHGGSYHSRLQDEFDPLISELLHKVELDNLSHIPARNYAIIETYLVSRKPNDVLDEIEDVLKQLYEAIKSNFSLQDILLKVGDKRFSPSNPYIEY